MIAARYVYALIRAEDAADFSHLNAVSAPDQQVVCLPVGDLAAVVSPIAMSEVMSTRRHMLTHTKVLEAVMADRPMLPVRFGVISATETDLRATITPETARLLSLLERLDGKIEMGLKVRCDEAAVMRAIVAERPDIAARYEKLSAGDPQATQFQRVDLGREVAALRGEWRDAERARLAERFADLPVEMKVHEPGDDDLLVFNAAFLVDRAEEPKLLATVEALDNACGDIMTFHYVGPAPAYNFVSVRLNWTPPPAPANANLAPDSALSAAAGVVA